MARALSSVPGAVVRLEVRLEGSRPAVYEVGDGGFLIGSVPGCDLRLPGSNLAPVVCLIARHPRGASLRKLAAVMPLTVNGRATSSTYLADGDAVSVGSAEVRVRIVGGSAQGDDEFDDRLREIASREQRVEQQRQELEAARVALHRRREEVEAECRRSLEEAARNPPLIAPEARDELTRRQAELDVRQAEIETVRQELHQLRQTLSQRYQDRRDRILTQQQAIRRAARKVQARKAAVEKREADAVAADQEIAQRQVEMEGHREQLERERAVVEEQLRLVASRQQEVQRELHERTADLDARQSALTREKATLDQGQKQHQADLVRLDRIQAGIEQRQKLLAERAMEVDRKFEHLQRDSRDLEEQAAQLDEWHTRLTAQQEHFGTLRTEVTAQVEQQDKRAAALEGQQSMLASLRTRLERMREELRAQEQTLSDQRAMQDASETELKARLDEAQRLRDDLRLDRHVFDEERRQFETHRATFDQAVAQLRLAQESITREQAELETRQGDVETTSTEQQEQAALILARGAQLEQMAAQLEAQRKALAGRDASLSRSEQTLAALQEQVRKRVEDLDARHRALAEREQAVASQMAEHEARCTRTEQLHQAAGAELDKLRHELEARTQQMLQRGGELARKADELTVAGDQHSQTRQELDAQRQGLAAERAALEKARQTAEENERQAREEFLHARDEAQALLRGLPELELRATAALERLGRGREQLRDHLAEVHAYARQSREDLESARRQVQVEAEKLRQQELELEVARDEHRLAVAAFRQQLIDWQGRVGEMRQSLQQGSSQLELRQAEIDARAREVADTCARLAEETEQLEQERRAVAERRGEMDRHLSDMREWYRKKLRELARVDAPAGDEPGEGDVVPMPTPAASESTGTDDDRSPARAVLTLNDEIEPIDRQLGELLASLGLVDDDTLQALWADARRQRRSLRQLLLAGGYLTLYQMALIEAGTLDGLVLGPVRVIDRLPSTPREGVFRVYDPTRNAEAMLRHLAEAEMNDAVRPDEFRQRFAAASAVQHGNVAAVLELLEIGGRPAALVEWVNGLPAADWPNLVSAPGVWYRLVCQAALALHAVHEAGLVHGHLDDTSFVLNAQGTLKLVGLGVPLWLTTSSSDEPDSPDADLAVLGELASAWAEPAKGSKSKPWPEELQTVLSRLRGEGPEGRYASARALVAALDEAGAKLPSSTTAWDRLLRQVRDQSAPAGLRETA